jgi:hypothetical protein
MATRRQTRDVGPLTLRADVVPRSVDVEARTATLTWTTGAPVLRGYFEPFWEELSLEPKHVRMKRLKSGAAPLLNSHASDSTDDVIGVVESAELEAKRGTAVVRFARDQISDGIFQKVVDGILRNVSVGYRVYKMVRMEDGEGKTPVYRAVDWEPYEISIVPIGADPNGVVRASDSSETNPCVFEERTMDDDDTSNTPAPSKESPVITATRAAERARAEDANARAAAAKDAAEKAVADERARIAELRNLAKRTKLGDAWAQALIEAGTPIEEARIAALDHVARDDEKFSIDGTLRIGAGDDAHDKWIRGASAWLFHRTGTKRLIEEAKAKMPDAFKDVSFDPGEFRGMSPIDLARQSLERRGVDTRGMDRMKMIGQAFTHRSGNYQTAADFPVLLENVLSKVLLGGYATQPNTWERICKTDTVPDFRSSNRYRSASLPGLDVIAEHGEYKSGAVPDGAKYGIVTRRMGKMFSLSREAIVNDDMGALTDLAQKLGQTAQRSIENAVYALITANAGLGPTQGDGQPFFHANRANVNATGSALTVDGIEADATVMANQKDPNAQDFIDLQPAILLVPRALRGTALVVNNAEFEPAANKLQIPNRVRGLVREVIGTPRLTGTRRYMIADPLDWIVVAFLEGYGNGPVLESQDGWRIDGVEWKVTIYANAQMGDAKAAITNAGV